MPTAARERVLQPHDVPTQLPRYSLQSVGRMQPIVRGHAETPPRNHRAHRRRRLVPVARGDTTLWYARWLPPGLQALSSLILDPMLREVWRGPADTFTFRNGAAAARRQSMRGASAGARLQRTPLSKHMQSWAVVCPLSMLEVVWSEWHRRAIPSGHAAGRGWWYAVPAAAAAYCVLRACVSDGLRAHCVWALVCVLTILRW